MPEHFNIKTKENMKDKFEEIKNELKIKANSIGEIKRIELYECEEI